MEKPFFPSGKMLFQHFFHHVLGQQLHFPFIRNPEGRIQTDVLKIVAQHKQAEAVNRGNLGVVNNRRLPLQMLVSAVLIEPL